MFLLCSSCESVFVFIIQVKWEILGAIGTWIRGSTPTLSKRGNRGVSEALKAKRTSLAVHALSDVHHCYSDTKNTLPQRFPQPPGALNHTLRRRDPKKNMKNNFLKFALNLLTLG